MFLRSVGIDTVMVSRCEHWKNFSDRSLLRIFTVSEVEQYRTLLKSSLRRSTEFVASRFAVKEAAFKAVSHYVMYKPLFLPFCRAFEVRKNLIGLPVLHCDKEFLPSLQSVHFHISLAHDRCHVSAIVMVTVP